MGVRRYAAFNIEDPTLHKFVQEVKTALDLAAVEKNKPNLAIINDGANVNVSRKAGVVDPVRDSDTTLAALVASRTDRELMEAIKSFPPGDLSSVPTDISSQLSTLPTIPDTLDPIRVTRYNYVDMMMRSGTNPLFKLDPKSKAFEFMKTTLGYQTLILQGAISSTIERMIAGLKVDKTVPILAIPVFATTQESFAKQCDFIYTIINKTMLSFANSDTSGVLVEIFKSDFNQVYTYEARNSNHKIAFHLMEYAVEKQTVVKGRKSDRDAKYEYVTYNPNPMWGGGAFRRSVEVGDTVTNAPIVKTTVDGTRTFDRTIPLTLSYCAHDYFQRRIGNTSPIYTGILGSEATLYGFDCLPFSIVYERVALYGIAGTDYDAGTNVTGCDADLFSEMIGEAMSYFQGGDISLSEFDDYLARIFGSIAGGVKGAASVKLDEENTNGDSFWKNYYYDGTKYYPLTFSAKGWFMLRAIERDVANTQIYGDLNPKVNSRKIAGYAEGIRSHRVSTAKLMRQTNEMREAVKNMIMDMVCFDFSSVTGAIRLANHSKGDILPSARLM